MLEVNKEERRGRRASAERAVARRRQRCRGACAPSALVSEAHGRAQLHCHTARGRSDIQRRTPL